MYVLLQIIVYESYKKVPLWAESISDHTMGMICDEIEYTQMDHLLENICLSKWIISMPAYLIDGQLCYKT